MFDSSILSALRLTLMTDECDLLKIEVAAIIGEMYKPRELFTVPLEAIEQSMGLLISCELHDYRHDLMSEMMSER